jgi:hypothetical protein
MKREIRFKFALVLITLVTLPGFQCTPTSRDAVKALRNCGGNAIQTAGSIVYFGPNSIPIGTIYEKEGSGYDPLWKGTTITGDPPPADMVQAPDYAACTSNSNVKVDLKLTFGASATTAPISGSLSNDFTNSSVLNVTADAIGWETLYKGPYQSALVSNTNVKNDISSRDAYVTIAILKVKGYSVDYKISSQDTASLQAKYAPPSGHVNVGQLTGGLDYTWSNDGTLSFKAPDQTNIGGVMRAINKGAVASASSTSDMYGASVGNDGDRVTVKGM